MQNINAVYGPKLKGYIRYTGYKHLVGTELG